MDKHPSKIHAILPEIDDDAVQPKKPVMDYEQASVESFDAAAKAVADLLTVRNSNRTYCSFQFRNQNNQTLLIKLE